MKFELRVRSGAHTGKVVPLTGAKFLIGREQDCHLRPISDRVSRHHCVFSMDEFGLRLRDLGSTNGTLVNGKSLRGEATLQPGDSVQVGTLEFDVVISDRLIDCLAPSQADSCIRCRIPERPDAPVELLCEEIRSAFDSNHLVFCPCSGESRLAAELAAEASQAKSIVGRGFGRVIVLDAAGACDASGLFDIEVFWKNTFISLSRELGLDVPVTHHNDRSCIEFLLDLRKSLLCLLNVDRAPTSDLGSLRSMTQEQHPALIQYRSAAPGESERGNEDVAGDLALEKGLSDTAQVDPTPPQIPDPHPSPEEHPYGLPQYPLPQGYPYYPAQYPQPPGQPSDPPATPPAKLPPPAADGEGASSKTAAEILKQYMQRRSKG